jgi:hypothetical protein
MLEFAAISSIPFYCSIYRCRFHSIKPDPAGTVSDAMCRAHHLMQGKTPAQCTRHCVKQDSDFALISGGKIYTVKGDKTRFNKFTDENVVVNGKVAGTTVSVDSITASKS